MNKTRAETPDDGEEFEGPVIDIEPPAGDGRHRARRWVSVAVVLLLLFALTRAGSVYIEALWFGSLGYSSIYWTAFEYGWAVFAIFAAATFLVSRVAFMLMERGFAVTTLAPRRVVVNNEQLFIRPARVLKPAAWGLSLLLGLVYGAGMSESWQTFALWLNRPRSSGSGEPIFGNTLGFYLFTLPAFDAISSWLLTLAWIVLIGAFIYSALGLLPSGANLRAAGSRGPLAEPGAWSKAYTAVSSALAFLLAVMALRAYLSRYDYLFEDHQIFSGVTYTEDHWVLPGLVVVAIALAVGAALALANAFAFRRLRPLVAAAALPALVYMVAVVAMPGYVQKFTVEPNQLERESPYITHNIEATRRAFNLERVEARDFAADADDAAYALDANRPTLDNLRIWDYHALQDTLRQVQEIRTYYDFNDVDIDRYTIGGQTRQVLLAARELDVSKLPASSRGNWINERLIYTHGYGATMNTANGFTPEGRPEFLLSNMPAESSAPEVKLARPQIYFGEKTDTNVYVSTRQKEFDYPQGDANASTTYEGAGGFAVGGSLRRLVLAWELGDTSRLPFADDVTPDSRVLMRRNIRERVRTLAPFLLFDEDPYIVVRADGGLSWIMDAYTTSESYPYARHQRVGDSSVNYVRNSVKAVVDAYTGATSFYVFDRDDPVLAAYRSLFPALFRDSAEMPSDLRAHVRYPEALLKAQAEAYGLYHTENPKVFFQREDVWSLARESAPKQGGEAQELEPYYALLQLPGSDGSVDATPEFVDVVAFTPASRDNLIGWMAGRSDGNEYGSLLVYKFPKTKLVNGPAQVNARIDQNAQLSSQLTLWNQQGSRAQRGNLLVVPLGRGLLYVQAIYLQAERSPMPELRLVVLATQDRLAFGTSFPDALSKLFGLPETGAQSPKQNNPQGAAQSGPSESPQPSATATTQELIDRAAAEFADYQRLTSEGKLGEAGQKLESLKHTLEELQKSKR